MDEGGIINSDVIIIYLTILAIKISVNRLAAAKGASQSSGYATAYKRRQTEGRRFTHTGLGDWAAFGGEVRL